VFAGFILLITGIIGNMIAVIGLIVAMVITILVPAVYASWLAHR
jgi:uncharacterized membrane protein required for colicin V production